MRAASFSGRSSGHGLRSADPHARAQSTGLFNAGKAQCLHDVDQARVLVSPRINAPFGDPSGAPSNCSALGPGAYGVGSLQAAHSQMRVAPLQAAPTSHPVLSVHAAPTGWRGRHVLDSLAQ
jgi:hypothetical protein